MSQIPPHHDPACWGCGDNPIGLHLPQPAEIGATEYEAYFEFDERHQGGPGIAHGGLVAGALDEAVGLLATWYAFPAVTARIFVRYRRPVPINTELLIRAWLDEARGRRLHVNAAITDGARGLRGMQGGAAPRAARALPRDAGRPRRRRALGAAVGGRRHLDARYPQPAVADNRCIPGKSLPAKGRPPVSDPPPPDSWPTPEDETVVQQRETMVGGTPPPVAPPPVGPPADRRIGAGMLLGLGVAGARRGRHPARLPPDAQSDKKAATTTVTTSAPATTTVGPEGRRPAVRRPEGGGCARAAPARSACSRRKSSRRTKAPTGVVTLPERRRKVRELATRLGP